MKAMVLDDFDESWKSDAIITIVELSLEHNFFSADDLTHAMRPPNRPAQVGAAFRSAQAQGLIESIGSRISTNTTRNHGRHLVWRRKVEGVTK